MLGLMKWNRARGYAASFFGKLHGLMAHYP
jgi:hypothetical protein